MDSYQAYTHATEVINMARAATELVDEVAICFQTEEDLIGFVEEADRNGLEHFNSVPHDTMRRQDVPGEIFSVRFEFLRIPTYPWRIEAMCVLDGKAPLHQAALSEGGNRITIHVSYKMATLHDYQEDVRRMMSNGQVRRAEYSNSYGMFSYWDGPNGSYPYIKPRVNLRD